METQAGASRRAGRPRIETALQREHRLSRQRMYNRARRSHSRSNADSEATETGPPVSSESQAEWHQRLERQHEYNLRRRTLTSATSACDTVGTSESHEQQRDRLERQREYNQHRRPSLAHAERVSPPDATPPETDTQRRHRLARQRQYDRQRPANIVQEEARVRNEDAQLAPQTEDTVGRIEERLRDALGAHGLDECVCGVCDRLVLRRTSVLISDNPGYLETMGRVLKPPQTPLPQLLADQYNCEDIDPCFRGMMLARNGIVVNPSGVALRVCAECHGSLSSESTKPPKYAIANGFFVGLLPEELFAATWIEKVMTQLVTVVAQTRVMRGGRHRAIRSHCMIFDATPGPPATLLPRRIDSNGCYRVVLAGPMTDRQNDRIRKLHDVRGNIVRALLNFLKTNNPFYENVQIDERSMGEIEDDVTLCERIFLEHPDETLEGDIQQEQDSVVGRSDSALQGDIEDECSLIERNILLAPDEVVPDLSFVQRVVDLNADQPSVTPRLRVDHSSHFASSVNSEAKMHAHLFPFGRGHPGETRATPVSKRDCMKHYAMLSSRRFAQDPTFVMAAFARLAVENMHTLTSVKCKRFANIFHSYEAISRDDLATALINNERRQRGQSRLEAVTPEADRFLKSVELGSVSVWGSGAERRQCRHEAFGYQTRYGQPSLFVTLTPNSDNSYAMAHYAGVLSVDTLFDALEAQVPTRTEMKQAAMADDCASARLFMRTVDAFIAHVLGIDPKTKASRQEGGLFGKTKAFFGMIETQGRGTLHIHLLIWLCGAPVNSDDFNQQLEREGSAFTERLAVYANSIVTNSLPLKIEDVKCSSCKQSGVFQPLPIPASTRKQRKRKPSNDPETEPTLIECSYCGQKSSVQHVIRQLLLQNRPPHWPPPLTPLTNSEKKRRIDKEVGARVSELQAANIIRDREYVHSAIVQTDDDKLAEWVINMSDQPNRLYCHPDDDPFRQDLMTRIIEMSPPMLDSARMTSMHRDYMLSSLVANLNMHWWAHTGSCFKKSSSTSSAAFCRYGFPRERVKTSSLVALQRGTAEEFTNGYNPVIMAAFKCNHDIQILFGGKDAVNRIYYCCKYVTKPQRQIDCTTAVALASFQRRQLKEGLETTSETPPSVANIQRRRVASMVYTFTNKQEIAGPLAALYLLRGSCCYSSDICARLPLGDVLKQLESVAEYTCTLIPVGQDQSSPPVYKSASFLDDYIYRPEASTSSNLYEFVMNSYRRLRTATSKESHLFGDDHPLSASHCLGYRRKAAVPVIQGPRLPQRQEDSAEGDLEQFGKIALVLFKPFRHMNDLLCRFSAAPQPWFSAYSDWEGCRSIFTKTIMSNMADYHAGRTAEDVAVVDGGRAEESTSEDDDSGDDGYISDDGDCDGFADNMVDNGEVLSLIAGTATDAGERSFPTPREFPGRIQDILADFRRHNLAQAIARRVASVHRELMTGYGDHSSTMFRLPIATLKKWVNNADFDSKVVSNSQSTNSAETNLTERLTAVTEMFDDALHQDPVVWSQVTAARSRPEDIPVFCGVSASSRSFTLNELQHCAFSMIATHLLRRWRSNGVHGESREIISDEDLQNQQLLLFLGGEGGTGKSRVINAVKAFCKSWQRPGSALVAAMTGKAASIVNGQTLASLEMMLKSSSSHILFQDLDCLIIDEVSMMSKDQLLRLDRLLRKSKRVQDVPFGGIHIVLVGDFLQLPPVGADPIFVDPSSKPKASLSDYEGFRLWRRFQSVIILRESVRFRDDPAWGRGCSQARYGDWTPEFIQMINERVIGSGNSSQSSGSTLPVGTIFVTPDNEARAAINAHFIASTAPFLTGSHFPIRVVASFKGALNTLSYDDICSIMGMPDTKFGRMSPFLDLIPGMPIQITQNIRTKKGVANGTMGTLHSVHFPIGTDFVQTKDQRTGTTVYLPSNRPLYAFVCLNRGDDALPIADGLDPELFPVFPDAQAYDKATIPLTKSSSGEARTLTLKIQQFPFVCAVGATVYKVQGESLQSMAVVDWKVNGSRANKQQQAYLMVSRVVKREGLVCLHPFTSALAAWSKPSVAAVEEDKRLARESERSLLDFHNALRS